VLLVGIAYFRAKGADDSSSSTIEGLLIDEGLASSSSSLTNITAEYEYYLRHDAITMSLFCHEDMINTMDASEPYYRL
jgi:hypothetical protein